ncbi:unnamed protein product [Adineta steineri]|uniref:Nuclear receptor domain-containing protein n=1 Tax=Adineta steineri TaxID=433720 RepID=A0A814LUC0_9BILA|nr:unnamed protein product [Adineta steineri]CAF1122787.1 unnamed protein product [Adineta steineri]
MNNAFQPITSGIHYCGQKSHDSINRCVICGSKSIGINFGVLTCAPCKAFFRRNARRKELLELPCRHRDMSVEMTNNHEMNERTMRYLQIRRCSSCRLRRCFDMGMKEELVRTDEENERYRQLLDVNRRQRELLREQIREIKQLSIPQHMVDNIDLSAEIDWRHLSNIVYAYESCCIKTYLRQRSSVIFNRTPQSPDEQSYNIYPTTITMSIVLAVSSFLKTLPAYYSLPRSTRNYLCKTNIRPLIFPNLHELNQSCYAEPWQVNAYNKTWQLICGIQLYEEFNRAEKMAEKSWTTDPIVTRLFVVILFFSTPLHYHDDSPTPTKLLKKKQAILQTQNGYITLLWKYLTYRYGSEGSIRIYLNLVHVYMKMQQVGYGMYMQLTTQKDLVPTHETLSKLVTLDINDTQ